jgi:hypothetical protein
MHTHQFLAGTHISLSSDILIRYLSHVLFGDYLWIHSTYMHKAFQKLGPALSVHPRETETNVLKRWEEQIYIADLYNPEDVQRRP